MKQTTFASLTDRWKRKRTRRETFLAEMGPLAHWVELVGLIEPHYPKSGRRGRQPMPLESMRRIYFMQQWCAMSDPEMHQSRRGD